MIIFEVMRACLKEIMICEAFLLIKKHDFKKRHEEHVIQEINHFHKKK